MSTFVPRLHNSIYLVEKSPYNPLDQPLLPFLCLNHDTVERSRNCPWSQLFTCSTRPTRPSSWTASRQTRDSRDAALQSCKTRMRSPDIVSYLVKSMITYSFHCLCENVWHIWQLQTTIIVTLQLQWQRTAILASSSPRKKKLSLFTFSRRQNFDEN